MMTLHQLKIFEVVARHLNTTIAAEELGISQPSVSKQLKALQDEFRLAFYTATGRGIELTEEGRRFLNDATSLLRKAEAIKQSFMKNAQPIKTQLVVGGTESITAFLLPNLVKIFKEKQPQVQPIVRTADSQTIQRMLVNSVVDIGLITHPSYSSLVIAEPFLSREVVSVVSANHALARKRRLSREELASAPLVGKFGGRICRQFSQAGLTLNVVAQCDSIEGLKTAVRAGVGLGFFYRDTIANELKRGHFKLIKIPAISEKRFECFIICRKGENLSPLAQDFLELLRMSSPGPSPARLRN